ncbi:FAD-binding domain-containing protein [Aureobasidium pullulans EXF-150]|uniref:FAD-binding domain-containing protein n=1 Tax=Aureobasidium pullulans EXF-150 TaxID=1043002 RepID=A0A074XBY9_AURPU|nr:FAD-binding domain-containing protein [Aureobasidium pullulans EXF-150]KEQ82938.1 FAD-binding domain-containing protein [Aureobasidium pullulans EXF-150]
MAHTEVDSSLPIVWRDSADPKDYEEARVGRVFNQRRPQRFPIAVVLAETDSHVLQAVQLANKLDCRVSVRSGGHSWAAWSVRDNAVLIELGKLKHISVDKEAMIASVSPSTTGQMLNDTLSAEGLMFCGGHCPDVGLGGFLLQGGMGWNCRNWGWACENILALDVVTANGEAIHVDAKENSDLLWASKGAGPGFPAVITRFHLKIRKQIPAMLSSTFLYPIARYDEVMNWIISITPSFDSSTEIVAVSATPPGIDQLCIIPLFVTFQESDEECRVALQQANSTRPEGYLIEEVNKRTSLAKEYKDQANANPHGHRYCAENGYVKNDVDVAEVLKKAFTTLPTSKAFALWYAMAPCSRRELPDMALSMQSDHYFALYTIWKDEKDDDRCQAWVREIMKEVAPQCEGAYLGDSDFQVRQTKYWTDDKARTLMKLRNKWDPAGRICGYLDHGDQAGVAGLLNNDEWCNGY